MRKNTTIWLFLLLVFVIPLTAWALVDLFEKKWEKLPVLGAFNYGNSQKDDHRIATFSLVNQDSATIDIKSWKGRIVVADFFFTHCASICPKMTLGMQKIQTGVKNDNNIKFCSFSVDPERDSAMQLRKYAKRFRINTNNWDLVTGDKKEIYKLARNSFRVVATDGDGGSNDFIHSEKLVLIDKLGDIRGYYNGTSDTETSQLLQDIKKLKDEN